MLLSHYHFISDYIVPPMVANLSVTNETESDTSVQVLVKWSEADFSVVSTNEAQNQLASFKIIFPLRIF